MADRTVRVRLTADVTDYSRAVRRAAQETDRLTAAAEKFDGRTFKADFVVEERSAMRSLGRLDGSLGSTLRRTAGLNRALKTLSIGAGLTAGLPQLASLGGAAAQAAGSLALLPAAGFAAAAGVGALVVGMQGFGDALDSADPEEFAATIKNLAPSARETARQLYDMRDAWSALQQNVQQRLFDGVADRIDLLGRNYLPVLETALAGVAGELGDAADAFTDFANQADTIRDARDGLSLVQQAADSLAPTIVNLSEVFRDIGAVGAESLPRLGRGFEDVTERLAAFVAEGRRTGELSELIENGMDRTAQWGRVLADTAGIVSGVFDAAGAAGVDTLATLERLTAETHRWIDSTRGQQQMAEFFTEVKGVTNALAPGMRALAGAAVDVINSLSESGVLVDAAEAFSALMIEARPLVGTLGELAGAILPPLLATIKALAPVLGPAAAGFLAVKAATKLLNPLLTGGTGLVVGLTGASSASSNLARTAGAAARALPWIAAAALVAKPAVDGFGAAMKLIHGLGK